jgi:transcriptional regulator with XRE-family HTH domain
MEFYGGGRLPPGGVHVDGELIEHYRKVRAGLTRMEAAKQLEMSPTALLYIERGRATGENGKRNMRTAPATLQKIAQLLDVSPEVLVSEVETAQSRGRKKRVPASKA